MLDKTRQTNTKMIKNKAKRDGNDYVAPEYLGNKIGLDTRMKKEEEAGLREKLKKQVRNEKPGATEEGVDATVTRLMYEKNLKDAIPDDIELTLKPDMSQTLQKKIEVHRYHDGKFEVPKWEPNGKPRWSCCQCKYEDGPGCVVKKIDKERWVLGS